MAIGSQDGWNFVASMVAALLTLLILGVCGFLLADMGGAFPPRKWQTLYLAQVDCRLEARRAVWYETETLARGLGWQYAFVPHTMGGERFAAQMRQTKHNSVTVTGYHPRVGYSESFKPENAGKQLRYDAAGAFEGTPHWLSISAHLSDSGDRRGLVDAARHLKSRIENVCEMEHDINADDHGKGQKGALVTLAPPNPL